MIVREADALNAELQQLADSAIRYEQDSWELYDLDALRNEHEERATEGAIRLVDFMHQDGVKYMGSELVVPSRRAIQEWREYESHMQRVELTDIGCRNVEGRLNSLADEWSGRFQELELALRGMRISATRARHPEILPEQSGLLGSKALKGRITGIHLDFTDCTWIGSAALFGRGRRMWRLLDRNGWTVEGEIE